MPVSFSLTRYTRAHRAELLQFLNQVYSPSEAALRSSQWAWKYDHNPLNREPEPFLLLLRDDTTLIGMLGAIPLCIAVQGVEYPIVHACDLIVAPEYRGERLSERLITEYMRLNPVGFAWLNERSHRRTSTLKRSGWTRLTLLVKPLKPLALLQHILGRTGQADSALSAPLTGQVSPPAFQSRTQHDLTISQIFSFDARFDILWNRIRTQYPVIGARDSRFLNWRYTQRPDVRYLILTATQTDNLLGYLVVRLSETNGMRFGYFVDIAVADPADPTAPQLIRAGCEFLKAHGAAAAKCLVTTPQWRHKFYAHGFLPQFWDAQPYFHARSDRTELGWQTYRDVSWFLTMGDGDFEISL